MTASGPKRDGVVLVDPAMERMFRPVLQHLADRIAGSLCIRDRRVAAEFGVEGYVCLYEKHFIYWKLLGDGEVGIVTVLHERMHQHDRFPEDFPA